MTQQFWLWTLFGALVAICLAVDLGMGRGRHGRMPLRTAAIWSIVWIALAGVFAAFVWTYRGREDAELFVMGYLLEKSLSVDNMFVFIMIFSYFAVAPEDQPRVLKWGIIGALVFRGVLITAGYFLIAKFQWVLYIFAVLLVWAAWNMLAHGDEEIHPEENPVLNFCRKFFPIVNRYEGHHFFTSEGGKFHGTALLVVLIVIESTDIVFALDSIPAIFGIFPPRPPDLFIVFTSNVFAILGLRALFFVLAGIMDMFRFLKIGVAAILCVLAGKMIVHEVYKIPTTLSLGIIGGVLAASILASVLIKPRAKEALLDRPAVARPPPTPAAGDGPAKRREPAPERRDAGRLS